MAAQRVVLWFRNDLRVHDNALLDLAAKAVLARSNTEVLPVYCFDPRHFQLSEFGSPKTGSHRAKFLHESVCDLKRGLRALGSDLLVVHGRPEDVIPTLVKAGSETVVGYQSEVTWEETEVEKGVAKNTAKMKEARVRMAPHWGHTLYHIEDVPFRADMKDLPDGFTPFKDKVERKSWIREPLPTPAKLPTPPASSLPEGCDLNQVPSLSDVGAPAVADADPRGVMPFEGGELAGLRRMQGWIHDRSCLKSYFETRNGMLGADYSSKFSPWLAHGCLSPRAIYASAQRYEREQVKNKSTYWLVFELEWRDFFRFFCLKYGNKIFFSGGAKSVHMNWKKDKHILNSWKEGTTGLPLVDANMRELKATGFMSNRGRQNVASCLVLDLGLDWRLGADHFESLLVDSDVCSNYGNWNAAAGLTGGRVNKFNTLKQSKDYDPEAHYIKTWLPELAKVPAPKCFQPWQLSASEQQRYGVTLGEDYPSFTDLQAGVAPQQGGKGKGSSGKGNGRAQSEAQMGARFWRPEPNDDLPGPKSRPAGVPEPNPKPRDAQPSEDGAGQKRKKDRRGGKGGQEGTGGNAAGNAKREARFEAQRQRKQGERNKRASDFEMYG